MIDKEMLAAMQLLLEPINARLDELSELKSDVQQLDQRFSSQLGQVEEKFSSQLGQVEERFSSQLGQVEERFSSRLDQVEEKKHSWSVCLTLHKRTILSIVCQRWKWSSRYIAGILTI